MQFTATVFVRPFYEIKKVFSFPRLSLSLPRNFEISALSFPVFSDLSSVNFPVIIFLSVLTYSTPESGVKAFALQPASFELVILSH